MTTEQMIDRYNYLYALMKESKDVKNMKIFGEAEKYMFRELERCIRRWQETGWRTSKQQSGIITWTKVKP